MQFLLRVLAVTQSKDLLFIEYSAKKIASNRKNLTIYFLNMATLLKYFLKPKDDDTFIVVVLLKDLVILMEKNNPHHLSSGLLGYLLSFLT